ncbi:MAG TPA: hypothetical protein VEI24_02645, partial [Nitrospiria bacterium]|nr:hypothetical protein [Nitrospiria bacterium]
MTQRAIISGILGLGLAIIIAGAGDGSMARAADGASQKGRPIDEKYCLLCHGPQGLGDGPQGQ